ncbi:MAG: YeeE/YedE family protein [Acetobacter sp.]|uniref:YeeE/YedE family protein n=1 Tax=Acetobacter sp. TaxID=440 RepID=UPI0039E8C871
MNWTHDIQATCGGALIGLAAAVFLLLNGRIAGISGILGGLVGPRDGRTGANVAFIAGLVVAGPLYRVLAGHWPEVHNAATWPVLALAGALVGVGTRLGSGCTSGHGVCGLARLSPRSIVAVITFMATAFVTVFVTRHVLGILP